MAKAKKGRKPGRKQCSADGCRKFRIEDSIFCAMHFRENDGPERVVKVSEVEALRFRSLDAEIRNAMQGMQLQDFELEKLKRDFEAKVASHVGMRNHLSQKIKNLRPEYDDLINNLAKKYEVDDPKKMTIDPVTGIVRDLSKEKT